MAAGRCGFLFAASAQAVQQRIKEAQHEAGDRGAQKDKGIRLYIVHPECYKQFVSIADKLEKHYRDMQDMEFTIEEGKLFFLQTRNGKRTAHAAIQIACDLVDEGMITPEEAVCRIEAKSLDQLLHPVFDAAALKNGEQIGEALPASPGAAAGRVYFNADDAVAAHAAGSRVILVRQETSPEDIEGMHAAEGVLTMRGGMTSHAAVVARGMGTCCLANTSVGAINAA